MKVKKYLNPSSPLTKRKRRLFYFTPEQEKLFNLVTVPGTNVNSNATDARKTGVQALNFLAQEAARKDAEIENRSERKTVKRLTTVGERLRGDNGYSSYMSGGTGMSGRDPALGTIFDWTVGAKGIDALGKTALWNFAKYGPSNLFRGLARNYFINNAFKLELRKPILFGVGETLQPQIRTKVGDVEIDNPQLAYRQGKGITEDFIKKGVVEAKPEPEKDVVLDPRGWEWDFTPQHFDIPMFAQGRPWFGSKGGGGGDLLVTAEPLSLGNSNGGLVPWKGNGTFDVRYELGRLHSPVGIRRVPGDEQILNTSNTSAYRWEPGYGYRRVYVEDAPAAEWPMDKTAPQITAENAASITPEQWTAAQDAAIARGDMAEAQRLRDLHFKVSAPDNKLTTKLYHGTDKEWYNYDPTYFSSGSGDLGAWGKGLYLSGYKNVAKRYGKRQMSLYAYAKNPLEVKPTLGTWYDTPIEKAAYFFNREKGATKDIKNILKGKDAVNKYREITGDHWITNHEPYEEVVISDGRKLKLADAITYDDKGIRIPLGLRDNFNINDIRYGLLPFLGLGTASTLYKKKQGGKLTINNTDI